MKPKLLTIPLLFLICCLILVAPQQYSSFLVFASGSPDSYGNRVVAIWVAEWNDTLADYQFPYGQCKHAYTESGTNTFDGMNIIADITGVTLHEYTVAGFSFRLYDDNPLKIIIKCAGNKTIISDPSIEMRSYINITGIISNQQMTYQSYSTGTNYYLATFYYVWNSTGKPQSGVSYNAEIWFDAYY